ncbi:MAG TPA: STAS domain-containing protein [Solirubrobacteraceae bacterium]|nr:STAS domain-containing protein [Solirubrobacteraceae bacterium]
MQSHFNTDVRREGRGTIIALSGELDLASSAELQEELDRVGGVELLILDLRELEFIDSTGLSVLVKAHQEAQESGREFGLVKGGAQVQRLLALTGLEERLRIADAPDQLLAGS